MQRGRDAGCEGETSEAHHQRRNLWNFLVMAPSRQARQDPERGGAEGEEHSSDVMRIARPDDLSDLAGLGLTLAEGKRLLAGVQREIVAAQARVHAARRPACRGCGVAFRVKDYRHHAIATLFGRVTVRLPRFRCAGCATSAAGVEWPPHARSTPELDRLRAQLSALLTYRTAAALLGQLF